MPPEMLTLTLEQLQQTVTGAVESAIRAVNTVDEAARPAGPSTREAPAVLRRGYGLPRLGRAMSATFRGSWRSSDAFERDLTQAAAELWGYGAAEDDDPADPVVERFGGARSSRSIIWPRTRAEFAEVLVAMGERGHGAEVDRVDAAIRAMNEGTGAAGGFLVPTQYLQDQFAYALVSTTVLRQIPGVRSMPVRSNVVALPRESVGAGASQAAEAAALTSTDATLAQQTVTIKKQYGYRTYSNELLADADPAWNEFLANTLVRDVALQQDIQWIEGTGTGAEVTGFAAIAGTTAGAALGANGATPTFDHLFDTVYNLRAANVEPDFVVAHPRYLNSLSKIKDTSGNYLLSNAGGYGVPSLMSTGLPNAGAPKAVLLGFLPTWWTSQINIARTVGTSTDTTNVYVGNRNFVLILERSGIEVAFSEHVAFNNDQTAARAIGRSAIALTQPAALAVMTGVRA